MPNRDVIKYPVVRMRMCAQLPMPRQTLLNGFMFCLGTVWATTANGVYVTLTLPPVTKHMCTFFTPLQALHNLKTKGTLPGQAMSDRLLLQSLLEISDYITEVCEGKHL